MAVSICTTHALYIVSADFDTCDSCLSSCSYLVGIIDLVVNTHFILPRATQIM